ncbi:MAG: hypothetical protein QOF01_4272 [Thermomicrobiales bacterium]|nr:hypothetical protein [Thermomicrobiales bacterium]
MSGSASAQAAPDPAHPRPRPRARLGGDAALSLLAPRSLRLPLAAAPCLLALLRRGLVRHPDQEAPQAGGAGRFRRRRADAHRLPRYLQHPPRPAVHLEDGRQVLPAPQGQARPAPPAPPTPALGRTGRHRAGSRPAAPSGRGPRPPPAPRPPSGRGPRRGLRPGRRPRSSARTTSYPTRCRDGAASAGRSERNARPARPGHRRAQHRLRATGRGWCRCGKPSARPNIP